MWLSPLQCGPNGLMARFMAITAILTVWGIGLMIIILSTTIFLCRGEVSGCAVMISQRSSSFANLPSAKSLLEHSATFLSLLSSY
jgi:hypothetical protein